MQPCGLGRYGREWPYDEHERDNPYSSGPRRIVDLIKMLTDLENSEQVKGWQRQYGADFVMVIASGGEPHCGRGKRLVTNWPYAVPEYLNAKATVQWGCLDKHSALHEFGHSLGCQHDRHDYDRVHKPWESYFEVDAYGFINCNCRRTSVMSYIYGRPCNNLNLMPIFSDPNSEFAPGCGAGETGKSNNARVIREKSFSLVSRNLPPTQAGLDWAKANGGFFDPCDSNPCQNGGLCSLEPLGRYSCACPAGYAGVQCQTSMCLHADYRILGLLRLRVIVCW